MQNADLLRRNLCVCFSQITALLNPRNTTIYYGGHLSPDISCLLFLCFLTKKKTTQLNLPGKLDYTKLGFLLLLEELFAHLNVEHSKCLPASARKHYRA